MMIMHSNWVLNSTLSIYKTWPDLPQSRLIWFQLVFTRTNHEVSHTLVIVACYTLHTLHRRHNDHGGVSNHQPQDCLLNRLFRRTSKKTPKLRVTGLCAGNSPGIGEFPAQMASNAENVSIWWCHHVFSTRICSNIDKYNLMGRRFSYIPHCHFVGYSALICHELSSLAT